LLKKIMGFYLEELDLFARSKKYSEQTQQRELKQRFYSERTLSESFTLYV